MREIWYTMRERYRSKDQLAKSILDNLYSVKSVSNVNNISVFQNLTDICRITASSIINNAELYILNLRSGIDPVLEKLPDAIINRWLSRRLKHRISFKPPWLSLGRVPRVWWDMDNRPNPRSLKSRPCPSLLPNICRMSFR